MSYAQNEIILDLMALGMVLFVIHVIFSVTELYNFRRAINALARRMEKRPEKEKR